ncbi:hypothetical protein CRUP_018992 [Coryphaenoides rupestris]|nr:hypothetical protein CRUP_018992 [Coryphaenoides rupestris]
METWCMDAPLAVAMRGARDTGVDLVAVGGGGFTEDAPRPPVPGEEGELVCAESSHLAPPHHGNNHHQPLLLPFLKTGELPVAVATPRRPDLDLGYEPEGSASPTPPHLKWAESLCSLLDDQEGIHLFARFLKQEACADLLDFWFACSGFRKLEASATAGGGGVAGGGGGGAGGGVANEEKKLKLAKAIYRKYVLDGDGIVSRRIRPPSKCFIRDCVARQRIDPAMFDQAQAEIQTTMEESAYPLFLKSSVYLEYARTGGGGSESPKNVITTHQSSISGNTATAAGVPSGVYLPTLTEGEEWTARGRPDSGEVTGAAAPQCAQATPRRLLAETPPLSHQCAADGGTFQDSQECRHMAAWPEAASPYYVNNNSGGGGGYALVPTGRHPTDTASSIAERCRRAPKRTDASLYLTFRPDQQAGGSAARSGCPGAPGGAAPESTTGRPPPARSAPSPLSTATPTTPNTATPTTPNTAPLTTASCWATPPGRRGRRRRRRTPESILDDHVQRSPGAESRSPDGLSASGGGGGGAGGRHAPKGEAGAHHPSATGNNNSNSNNGGGGGGGVGPHHCTPTWRPTPSTQLEEVRRRLEEEESVRGVVAAASQPKQRYVMEVIQRGRAAVRPLLFPPLDVVPAVSDCDLSESEHRAARKPPAESTTVAYYFCGEPIPYRTSVEGRLVTLGHFKQLLTKRGSYRFYFKKLSDEFDCGVVFEEVREDDAILPIFEEKIIGKVEKID